MSTSTHGYNTLITILRHLTMPLRAGEAATLVPKPHGLTLTQNISKKTFQSRSGSKSLHPFFIPNISTNFAYDKKYSSIR